MPNTNQVVAKLSDLIQLDYDAIRAYEQAIRLIGDANPIAGRLESFKGDHQRHVDRLTATVSRLGGTAPRDRDLAGFLIQGFTAIGSAIGTKGTLRVMQSNEMLTSRTYADALAIEFPADVRAMVRQNYDDEKRHLSWIEGKITGSGR